MKQKPNYYNIIENTISRVFVCIYIYIYVTANASQTHTRAHTHARTQKQVHIFRNVWFINRWCCEKTRENKPADPIDDESEMMYYIETKQHNNVSLYNCRIGIGTTVYVIRNVHLFYTRCVSEKSTSEKNCCWMSDKTETHIYERINYCGVHNICA